MENKLRKTLALLLAFFLVTTVLTPAVFAQSDDVGKGKENDINRFASELKTSNSSFFDRMSAVQLLNRLKSSNIDKLVNRTEWSIKQYRDGYHVNTHDVLRNDSKTIVDLKKAVGMGQNDVVEKVSELLYLSDKSTVKKSIQDAQKLLNKHGKKLTSKQEKEIRKKIKEVQKAIRKSKEIQGSGSNLKKQLENRAKGVEMMWLSWIQLQQVIDTVDRETKPKVEITNNFDFPHKNELNYRVRVNVTDVQSHELENASFHLNGNKKGEVKISSNIRTKPGSTIKVAKNISLPPKKSTVNVTVKDTSEEGIDVDLTIIQAITGPDLETSFEELRTAIRYWATNEPVPLTKGEKVSYIDLRKLFRKWKNSNQPKTSRSLKSLVQNTEKKIESGRIETESLKKVGSSKKKTQIGSDKLVLDGDGLSSSYETKITKTDPKSYDSDSSKTSENEGKNSKADALEDYDKDGLTTFREMQIGSDPFSKNSDGDKLPDKYEAKYSEINSGKTDSNDDGVADHEWDFDNDTLTIREEMREDTSPFVADRDLDGFNDSEEVKYDTNYTKVDTDNDGLNDPDEITVGTDPLKRDTDGDGTLDGDEKFTTKAENKSLGTTVKVTGKGNIAESVTIDKNKNGIFDTGEINNSKKGEIVDINVGKKFEEMKVKISYDESGVSDESNLSIYVHNDTRQTFVSLNSTVDKGENFVTAEVEKSRLPTQFVLMNTNEWESTLNAETANPSKYENRSFERVKKINPSPGISSESTKFSAESNLTDLVTSSGSNLCKEQATIPYSDYIKLVVDGRGPTVPASNQWHCKKRYEQGLEGFEAPVWVLVFADNVNGYGGYDSEPPSDQPKKAYNINDGKINVNSNHRDMEPTNDVYFVVKNKDNGTYFKFIEEHAGYDNKLKMGDATVVENTNNAQEGLIIKVVEKVPGEDCDSDGLPDKLEKQGIKTGYGTFYTDPCDADTDGDDLEDGKEIQRDVVVNHPDTDSEYFNIMSSPTDTDTDEDGVGDKKETEGFKTLYIDDHSKAENYLKEASKVLKDNKTTDTERKRLTGMFKKKTVATDPKDDDSDNDGLIDGYEKKLRTDPKNPNTDSDGLTDDKETKVGKDYDVITEKKHDPTMYDVTPPKIHRTTPGTNRYVQWGCPNPPWDCGADWKVVHYIDYTVEDDNTKLDKVYFLKDQQKKKTKDIAGRQDSGRIKLKTGVLKDLGIISLTVDGLKGIYVSLEVKDNGDNKQRKGVAAAGGLATMVGDNLVKLVPTSWGKFEIARAVGLWSGVNYGISGLVKSIKKVYDAITNPNKIKEWIDKTWKALGKIFSNPLMILEAFKSSFRIQMEKTDMYDVDRSKSVIDEYLSQGPAGQGYALGWVTGYLIWTVGTLFFPGGQAAQALSSSSKIAAITSRIGSMASKVGKVGRTFLDTIGATSKISRGLTLAKTTMLGKGVLKAGGFAKKAFTEFTSTGGYIAKLNRLRKAYDEVEGNDIDVAQAYAFTSNAGSDSIQLLRKINDRDNIDTKKVVDPDFLENDKDIAAYHKAIGKAYSSGEMDIDSIEKAVKTFSKIDGDLRRASRFADILDESPVKGLKLLEEFGDAKVKRIATNAETIKRFELARRAGDNPDGFYYTMKNWLNEGEKLDDFVDSDKVTDDMVDRMFAKMAKTIDPDENAIGKNMHFFMDYITKKDQGDTVIEAYIEVDNKVAHDMIKALDESGTPNDLSRVEVISRQLENFPTSPTRQQVFWAGVTQAHALALGEVKRVPEQMNASWVLKKMEGETMSASDKAKKAQEMTYELGYITKKVKNNNNLELVEMWNRSETDALIKKSDKQIAYEVIEKDLSEKKYSETKLDNIIEHYNKTVKESGDVDDFKLVFTHKISSSIKEKLNKKNIEFEYFIKNEIRKP